MHLQECLFVGCAVQLRHLNEFFDLSSWSNRKTSFLLIILLLFSSPTSSACALGLRDSGVRVPCGLTVSLQVVNNCQSTLHFIFFITLGFSSCWQRCHFVALQWSLKRRKTSRLDCVQPSQDVHTSESVKEWQMDERRQQGPWLWRSLTHEGTHGVSGCSSSPVLSWHCPWRNTQLVLQ